jgi:hypothetical protein
VEHVKGVSIPGLPGALCINLAATPYNELAMITKDGAQPFTEVGDVIHHHGRPLQSRESNGKWIER